MEDAPDEISEVEPRSSHPNGWKIAFFCLLGLNVLSFISTVTLLVAAVHQAREAAHRSQCRGNLKNLARATANNVAEYRKFPPAFVADDEGKPLYSWRVILLPFLDEDGLYRSFHLSEPCGSARTT